MHRSLSGSPGDCGHHTERTRSDGRISLTCCRNISTVWNSSESKWLRLQNFPENCHEHLFQTEHVKNILTALHLILWQGFNKYIIRTASSRLQSEDPQMTCQQTSHSLFTDAYCTQELAEITSSDSDLIKQCCACSLIIWNKDISCFHNEIEISKQNCVWFFFSEFVK